MPLFALATLTPFALLALGALWGGVWPWLALLWMTGLTALIDRMVQAARPPSSAAEFPAGEALSALLALAQIAVLALVVWRLGTGGSGAAQAVALFIACALVLGQIGNSNAHELIHRPGRFLRRLGIVAYISVLYGQHASAHVLVHHIRVATEGDPASARRGESLYAFIPRAWWGSLRAGFHAESRKLRIAGRSPLRHPYLAYALGGLAALGAALALGGARGLGCYLGLCAAAQIQLLMSDYVQHYGLRRRIGATGKPAPFGPEHAWNAPHPMSSAMMLNAPRHSDHHGHPLRPYPALRLPQAAPMLPHALPVMAVIALVPPLWRRVMHPRLKAWEARQEADQAAL